METNVGGKKGDENLKTTIPNTEYVKSKTSQQYGIFWEA
jgi:hypothetical protein